MGTGRRYPKTNPSRELCPACWGDGDLEAEHPWAGYESVLDFRGTWRNGRFVR